MFQINISANIIGVYFYRHLLYYFYVYLSVVPVILGYICIILNLVQQQAYTNEIILPILTTYFVDAWQILIQKI